MNKIKEDNLVNMGGYFSTFAYLITAIMKIVFGIIFNSSALYTDGLNSTSDVISTLIIMIGLQLSKKPGDAEHKYGHHRIEQIATLFASFIMFFIGIQSVIQAIEKIRQPDLEAPNLLAAFVAFISIVIITISAIFNNYAAKKTNVQSAKVIAKHNMSDAISALGALIAVVTSQWNMPMIDPIVSLIIAGIILYTAYDIFRSSSNSLIDGFNTKNLSNYNNVILNVPGVERVIDIKGRMLGNSEILDVTVTVNSTLTIGEAHIISDAIELELKQKCGIMSTHVHIEPDSICKLSAQK